MLGRQCTAPTQWTSTAGLDSSAVSSGAGEGGGGTGVLLEWPTVATALTAARSMGGSVSAPGRKHQVRSNWPSQFGTSWKPSTTSDSSAGRHGPAQKEVDPVTPPRLSPTKRMGRPRSMQCSATSRSSPCAIDVAAAAAAAAAARLDSDSDTHCAGTSAQSAGGAVVAAAAAMGVAPSDHHDQKTALGSSFRTASSAASSSGCDTAVSRKVTSVATHCAFHQGRARGGRAEVSVAY